MPFKVVEGGLNEMESLHVDIIDGFEEAVPVVMLSASSHTAYVNTAALKCVYARDQQGFESFRAYREHVNSHGGLHERNEIVPALTAVPKEQKLLMAVMLMDGLDTMFKLANERGVTMLYDAGMPPTMKPFIDAYILLHGATVRIGYAQLCNSLDDAEKLPDYEPLSKFENLFCGSIKIVSDGSNQGLTGYQHETYSCKPENNKGFFNFEPREFNAMVKTCIDKEWPMMIHANGSLALEKILEAYEQALGGVSGLEKRHRIEHCSLPKDEAALKKMHDLGISPSFLIAHVGYWGYAFDKCIFEKHAQKLHPCQSALRQGMRISLHSDCLVSPLGPLRLMEQAVTRIMEKDPDRRVLNVDERLTPEQALLAVTYDAAWQCHVDKWMGSLEAGKMADYVILKKDPITMKNPVGMRDIPVLETWVGGVKVFEATPVKEQKVCIVL